jgi:uncharacterized phage protein (TIGR02218 family)
MRTALWETSTGALAALLNSGAPLTKADLFTLTLAAGTVYRWSGCDVALSGGGNTWTLGPGLKRTAVKFATGVQTNSMTVTVTDNVGTTISGNALIPFIQRGGLYGARMQVDKAFWGVADAGPVGALLWFEGRVADTVCDRYGAEITVNSDLELLDVMVPRNVYQAGCLNTLFDSACGLSQASNTVTGTAATALDATGTLFGTVMSQANHFFDLGVVTFTTGLNAGISRTVKAYYYGTLCGMTVVQPWPFAVAVGDAFAVYPGCDKTQPTCTSKFSNLVHFRGMPYIPVPETVA